MLGNEDSESYREKHDGHGGNADKFDGGGRLWRLLPSESAPGRGLPVLDPVLLQDLTDLTSLGIERYRQLVLYAVRLHPKYFSDLNPMSFNTLSGFGRSGSACDMSYFGDAGSRQALRVHSKSSSFDLVPRRGSTDSEDHDGLRKCSPFAELALAATMQNPEVVAWVGSLPMGATCRPRLH